MASLWNSGIYVSIFGESHGKAIGVLLDNVPCGIEINFEDLRFFVSRRTKSYCDLDLNLRKEPDRFEILSGIFNNKTTGSPICCIIGNEDVKSNYYEQFKDYVRPGHCDLTTRIRYGGFNDYRGGGHYSGRLTASLVLAGAICGQILKTKNIKTFSHIFSIGKACDVSFLDGDFNFSNLENLPKKPLEVVDWVASEKMKKEIEDAASSGDSVGGVVECSVVGAFAGIGSPIFDGVENYISHLVFGIPGVCGIEFGSGFKSASMKGSEHNDEPFYENGKIKFRTNNSGGILGGISCGMPIVFKVAFKPTPTIFKAQTTVNLKSEKSEKVKFKGRHDVCIAARAPSIVEAAANVAILSQLINSGKF